MNTPLEPMLYPPRSWVEAGKCGTKPLADLIGWTHGRTFHRYGVNTRDRDFGDESVYDRIGKHPPLLEFTSRLASHATLDWTLKFRQVGDPASFGMTTPHMTPEDAAYAALTLIEDHDRELYEQTLVVGIA